MGFIQAGAYDVLVSKALKDDCQEMQATSLAALGSVSKIDHGSGVASRELGGQVRMDIATWSIIRAGNRIYTFWSSIFICMVTQHHSAATLRPTGFLPRA